MWNLLIPAVTSIIDKLIPDPAQAAEAKLKALEMAQKGELAELDAAVKLAAGQLAVNQAEATSPNVFVSGWRPFIGWVCGAALVYHYILRPMLPWLLAMAGKPMPPIPPLDMGDLITILLGMLGLGSLRSFEKTKGVA
jgi:hypothetical protein